MPTFQKKMLFGILGQTVILTNDSLSVCQISK